MRLTGAIQEALVGLLCYFEEGSIVDGLIDTRLFDPIFREFADAAIEYRRQFKAVPGDHTIDLLETLNARHPDKEKQFLSVFESLDQTREGLNVEYVLKQAGVFARSQNMKVAISKALDELDKEDEPGVLAAEAVLGKASKGDLHNVFDPGGFFHDTDRALRFLTSDESAPMHVGIPELDRYDLGPSRKTLHLFVAPTGTGKSWWLCHLAKMALMQRKRVLYVTLEMSEEKVHQRLVQSFFSVRKRDVPTEAVKFKVSETGRFLGFNRIDVTKRQRHMEDPKILKFIRPKLDRFRTKAPLLVREFPTKKLTVRQLESFLDVVQNTEKFIPDVLLIDYADLIAPEGHFSNKHDALLDTYERLRGLAQERNLMLATATQTNRGGKRKRVVDSDDVAEAFGKIWIADNVFTYNQTEFEKQMNLARIFVSKGRQDKDGFQVLITQLYQSGAFRIDSALFRANYWKVVDDMEETEEDEGEEEASEGKFFSDGRDR